jgi:hypothetical protein
MHAVSLDRGPEDVVRSLVIQVSDPPKPAAVMME